MISVSPSAVSETALQLVRTVIVIGEKPAQMLREFAEVNGSAARVTHGQDSERRSAALAQGLEDSAAAFRDRALQDRAARRIRKYAESTLPEERS